jgi:hypothetical protein
MIPKVDNDGEKHCRADVKESADVPKQSTGLCDVS